MALYDAFDSITEPRRQQSLPLFLRVARARRTRTTFLAVVVASLVLLLTWRTSAGASAEFNTASYRSRPQTALAYAPQHIGEAPVRDPHAQEILNITAASSTTKTSPSFHLLIPASRSNPNLCKTLLSSFVLGYPSPTLINYGKVFEGLGWDNGTHAGKIRGVYDYLKGGAKVDDDDLVLIVDGYDVWFQLPPAIMLDRYHSMLEEANERLRRRYGMVMKDKPDGSLPKERVQKYTQSVIFAADKICWPNAAEDPACAAVPYSTLPKDVYGPDTDKDPASYLNRPRFLNSGTIIGPVKDVRAIYERAVKKVEEDARGTIGDQFVFAEILGEQEFQRETRRQAAQGTGGRWLDWISNALGASDSPLASNHTIHNMTAVPGQSYEFSLGLDYRSELFQTVTHSWDDIAFVTYNDSSTLVEIQEKHPSLHSIPFSLPPDLQRAEDPFWYASPGSHTNDPVDSILLPFSPKLDTLGTEPSWEEVPLATNLFASSIPTLLHINGDKSPLDTWWPLMWFHPHARALLRRFIRSPQGPAAAQAAAEGGQTWWDMRGGRGGVWTDHETWMSWGEVCKKTEDEVFGDGKGTWGKEEGSVKTTNSFGLTLTEDENDEEQE